MRLHLVLNNDNGDFDCFRKILAREKTLTRFSFFLHFLFSIKGVWGEKSFFFFSFFLFTNLTKVRSRVRNGLLQAKQPMN